LAQRFVSTQEAIMANPEPIPVTATHELHQRGANVPAGTLGEIISQTWSAPIYYIVSFWVNGERVTVDHLTRMDLHEA